jgi:Uma2 family endonuclease
MGNFGEIRTMDTLVIDRSKKWTVEDYLQMEEGVKCEILNGELIMTPAPLISHQRTVGLLYQKLVSFINLRQLGELFFAPVDVFIDRENVYQPDLVFVTSTNSSIIQEKGIMGTPNLVAEITSPTSSYIDRYAKKAKYEQFGVQEYWIVDPANKTLEIFEINASSQYKLLLSLAIRGKVLSNVLKESSFELAEIF